MMYDRRQASNTDTDSVFEGFYTRKPLKDVLHELVRAYQKPVDDFLARLRAEVDAGEASAGRPMIVPPRELHTLIVKYLLENYGMERSLAKGLADQILYGQNY